METNEGQTLTVGEFRNFTLQPIPVPVELHQLGHIPHRGWDLSPKLLLNEREVRDIFKVAD